MTKVDIISGFLGAGKTTLIKKLLKEVYANQQVVLIENEFGEIGIDGGFLKEAGINITEMNSGCICCSLVGDFGKALKEVTEKYHPDRIIIEPSGVGKLSDVRKAVEDAADAAHLEVNSLITVANASKIKMYMRTFGEFYNNQVENAGAIILSRTQNLTEEKQMEAAALVREKNPNAVIITTPWDDLTGQQILDAIEGTHSLAKELMEEAGLSNDHPVFHPVSDTAADKLRDEMLRLTQYPDNSRPLGIIGQLYLIMDALIQGSSNKKRLQGGKLSRFYAQEALSFIEQNYTLPITVEDMANRCNLDRSYFGKVFKDMTGQSPQDFLIRYRMSKATTLLTSTSLSIGDISVQVGYPNQLHFSRAFRNIYGMSPRQYRQQNKLLS